MRLAFAFAFALAACSDGQTAIRIDVRYDDSWALTGLALSSGTSSSTTEPTHTVTIIVPDAWDGQPQAISVFGMRGADQWAQGTATVTPKRGDTVDAHASLALLSCATSCIEGSTTCVAGGVATCEQHADSCFDLSTPTACGSGTRCSGGGCVAGDLVVLPSNSASFGALEQTGMTLDVANGFVFDTDADCFAGSPIGNCAPIAPIGAPAVCVCHADTVTLHDLEVRGSRGLAILAFSSVLVQGNVVVKPGAGVGATSPGSNTGGSFGTSGGGGTPVATFGTADLVPLLGGMGGGGTAPGLGGGALQITADQMIRVEGSISVPGGGTKSTIGATSGSSGGSGGGLLLEARHVDIVGTIAANGGGGGGGAIRRQSNGDVRGGPGGADGQATNVGASGGHGATVSCSGHTYAYGGTGGLGSYGDNAGGGPSASKSGDYASCTYWDAWGGGGGGGGGRIRINTFSDACGCTGTLSPTPTYGMAVLQ